MKVTRNPGNGTGKSCIVIKRPQRNRGHGCGDRIPPDSVVGFAIRDAVDQGVFGLCLSKTSCGRDQVLIQG